jgi:hypothetical protein
MINYQHKRSNVYLVGKQSRKFQLDNQKLDHEIIEDTIKEYEGFFAKS